MMFEFVDRRYLNYKMGVGLSLVLTLYYYIYYIAPQHLRLIARASSLCTNVGFYIFDVAVVHYIVIINIHNHILL